MQRCSRPQKMRKPAPGGLVYSSEGGRMCPSCRRPVADCVCAQADGAQLRSDGPARVSRQTKGRNGKVVTVIQGLGLDPIALAALAQRLRTACGSGGTVKDGVVELQGDHRQRVVDWLKQEGWPSAR